MFPKILLHKNAIHDFVDYYHYKDYFQLYEKFIQVIDKEIALVVNEVIYLD